MKFLIELLRPTLILGAMFAHDFDGSWLRRPAAPPSQMVETAISYDETGQKNTHWEREMALERGKRRRE